MKRKSFALKFKKVKIADLNLVYGGRDPVNHVSGKGDSCTNTAIADTTCNTCETVTCPTTTGSTSEANSLTDTESLLDC